VDESVKWLTQNPQPDLILMDIQLSDGLSFNIFNTCNITCPVIFVTAYDKYLTQAFDYNSIDYLLKPINQSKLKNAIRKYKNLQSYFVNNHSAILDYLNNQDKKKSRILVKRGMEFQTVRVEDIVYFFTEHKLVFLVDKDNRKYLAEKNNLSELEEELDRNLFYRANRKYIINANYIKRFKPLDRSKLSVELLLPINEEIIISQENSSSFKKWISEM
jgi:two-component system LytT family response regulator